MGEGEPEVRLIPGDWENITIHGSPSRERSPCVDPAQDDAKAPEMDPGP